MTFAGPSKYETEIVRVFPDYARTVIWFGGPVAYPETGLSDDLVQRLTAWEADYYAALTTNDEWRSLETLHAFNAEGLELARAVSTEIGPEFEVEYRSFENPRAVAQLRSEEAASHPAAEAAFTALADRARAEWAALRARSAATPPGAGGGWYAVGSDGRVFRPDTTE